MRNYPLDGSQAKTAENNEIVNISATFTVDLLEQGLEFWAKKLNYHLKIEFAQYNQVFQQILLPGSIFANNKSGINIILLRIEDWIRDQSSDHKAEINKSLDSEKQIKLKSILDDFINTLKNYTKTSFCKTILLLCPSNDFTDSDSVNFIKNIQKELVDKVQSINGILLIHAEEHHQKYGIKDFYDPLRDEMGHIPYTNEYFYFLSTLIMRRYYSLKNKPYKVIVLDCDNTLWKGVCGEIGPDAVQIKDGYLNFQKFLVKQYEQGMLLALCSKNNEEDVWKVFDTQTQMPLKKDMIVDSKINWLPKSENLTELSKSLNLGIDSFVFIDDNPMECAEVRAGCPEVFVLEFPDDAAKIEKIINHFWLFDHYITTEEDKKRTAMYRENISRENLLGKSSDFQEFLDNLNLTIDIKKMKKNDLPRVAQLTERTNQFNFTTVRRSEEQIKTLLEDKSYECLTIDVKDRFGSYGLVGVIIYQLQLDSIVVDTFLLSCRVLGRGVEHKMCAKLAAIAQSKNLKNIKVVYKKTAKNEPARNFIVQIGHQYIQKEDADWMECILPVSQIIDLKYVPGKSSDEPREDKDSSKKVEPSVTPLSNKEKEDTLVEIAYSLSNPKNIGANKNNKEMSQKPGQNQQGKHYILIDQVIEDVKECFAEELAVSVTDLNADSELSQLQIDSYKIIEITARLAKKFHNVPTTLLFEYTTIQGVAGAILENNKELAQAYHKSDKTVSKPELENSIENQEQQTDKNSELKEKEIAIIGISGRYPKSNNLYQFWNHLVNGDSCISEVSNDRWDVDSYFDASSGKNNKSYSKWGGFIDDCDKFDALFFSISPTEAETMDPQQRIFLEVVWAAIEDAGYTPKTIDRNTAVYAGVISSDYCTLTNDAAIEGNCFYRNSDYYQIPNRVSYFFNFSGPSMAIDTACSASGTAIHLACESLKRRECKTAIVGGVNLFLYPSRFIQYSHMQMMSHDNRCKPFGQGADGTIFGEGVGAVLLKPLLEAQKDKDTIYGVIKGTAINSGGKTNGFTVPNPQSQAEVIKKALDNAGVDSRTISYIEAHGTGTSLGDPIEIRGLSIAFDENNKLKKHKQDKQYCAIGSVKSNIGHLESGAAIVGLIKVLLQLKYKKIVPSINSDIQNPLIKFKDTPFVVQNQLADWNRPKLNINGELVEFPRRAGISSFGAGGSNSHIIVQEYVEESKVHKKKDLASYIIVLSGKDSVSLKKSAEQLLEWLNMPENKNVDIMNLSYTLQIGREAMEERMGIEADSVTDLVKKLSLYLEGRKAVKGIYSGKLSNGLSPASIFNQEADLASFIENWIQKKKYSSLIELWCYGVELDWNRLYDAEKPNRINLPTYPFTRERYWIEESSGSSKHNKGGTGFKEMIHPLLHQNISNLAGQMYISRFTGTEFFFRDHILKNRKVLPGVAFLEMARASVENALTGMDESRDYSISLKNVMWVKPIIAVDEGVDVQISLTPSENGDLQYEIYQIKNNGEIETNGQGSAAFSETAKNLHVNIHDLMKECDKDKISGSKCYELYKKMGLDYGESFQSIKEIYTSRNAVLGKIVLPEAQSKTETEFLLHPSILDGALQVIIGLVLSDEPLNHDFLNKPPMPFVLGELEIFGKCGQEMWVYVRHSKGSKSGDNVEKLDIDLIDSTGKICVRLKEYVLKRLEGDLLDNTARIKTYLLERSWKDQKADVEVYPAGQRHIVILCGKNEVLKTEIEKEVNGISCVAFSTNKKKIEERYKDFALQLFDFIKGLILDKTVGNTFIQLLLHEKEGNAVYLGLSGLLKTAHLENPKINGQVIAIDHETDSIKSIKENYSSQNDPEIKYENGVRYISSLTKVIEPDFKELPFKDGGVYIITGGKGGLGRVLLKDITTKIKDAIFIITGLSNLTEAVKDELSQIEGRGNRIEFRLADISDKEVTSALINGVIKEFGKLNGIVHAAGIIRDNYIIKKTREEMLEVMKAKIDGLVNIAQASKGLELDFILTFSSVSGVLGSAGQADYALANEFIDRYTEYSSKLMVHNNQKGIFRSIAWPLWEEGGMKVDAQTELSLKNGMGMTPMKTKNGLNALYTLLSIGQANYMVMEGIEEKMLHTLFPKDYVSVDKNTTVAFERTTTQPVFQPEGNSAQNIEMHGSAISTDSLKERVEKYLKQLLSPVIKMPANKIEADAKMEKYGIDSLMTLKLTNELEKYFGSLSKTLFYEYQNIRELAEYFLNNYEEKVKELTGSEEKPRNEMIPVKAEMPTQSKAPLKMARYYPMSIKTQKEEKMEFAIVGLAGRYPGANNIDEFWDNLSNGVDSISEIPNDRWNHSLYFDSDKNKVGKTYSKWGGFIEGVDEFDPLFFNISPREAELIDPQERIFLECVYQTIEDAGYTRDFLAAYKSKGLEGNVGVFVGVMSDEYQLYGAQAQALGINIAIPGNPASIANRVSYFCNFHGPSMVVDTMCSSSITAIYLACQNIQLGECDAAIAGGVNVTIHPNKYLMLSQGKFISSKGRCESFGEGGDGYVPAEGVGAVMIKPLKKAVEDGDHIYGVIKGASINHGGKTNGYTVPNPIAQGQLISDAINKSGINLRALSYIEAHGTGTSLGDPIEIAGLTRAFQEYTKDKQFCAIGSAKSNIGHAESAAGIAGLTKVLLQMKHEKIVPSLHSKVLNPNINFENTPFVVQQELGNWEKPVLEINGEKVEYPRIAGISSFGAGGANAHIIIQEYKKYDKESNIRQGNSEIPVMILLTGKTPDRLKKVVELLLNWLNKDIHQNVDLKDLAYTLQVGREGLEERLAFTTGSLKELREKLNAYLEKGENSDNFFRGQVKKNKETISLFSVDDDLQKAIENWVSKGKYDRILDLWVKGLNLDWNLLYGNDKPRRISLPVYPFLKDKYWINAAERLKGLQVSSQDEETGKAVKTVKEHPIPAALPVQKKEEPVKVVLEVAKPVVVKQKEIVPLEQKTVLQKPVVQLASAADVKPAIKSVDSGNKTVLQAVVKKDTILKELKEILAEILYIKDGAIDEEEKFVDLGMDSITGVEMVRKVNKKYGMSINATKIYDYPNIKEFSKYIEQEMSKTGQAVETVQETSETEPAALEQKAVLQKPVVQLASAADVKPAIKSVDSGNKTVLQAVVKKDTILKELKEILAEILYIKDGAIDEEEKFVDLGMDSITGVEMVRKVNKKYGMSINATKIYDYPNIKEFSKYIEQEMSKTGQAVETVLNTNTAEPAALEQKAVFQKPVVQLASAADVKPAMKNADSNKKPVLQTGVKKDTILKELKEILAEILYIKDGAIDEEEKFIDLGMDSITGVEMVRKVNKKYGMSINATKIYDYPNINEFSKYIEQEMSKTGQAVEAVQETSEAEPVALEQKPVVQLASAADVKPAMKSMGSGNVAAMQSSTGKDSLIKELKQILAEVLYIKDGAIDEEEKFIDLGMDSITGVEMVRKVNKKYGITINATKIYDYPNIKEFAEYIGNNFTQFSEKTEDKSQSIDALLEQVYNGEINVDDASKLMK